MSDTQRELSWSFFKICNEAAERPERESHPRDYLWATDLGRAPVDVFLSMRGEKPTNPPNARSMRKFHAGNVWEGYFYMVLWAAGILKQSQSHLVHQYPGLLKVTGRQDFLAGGVGDWEKARVIMRNVPFIEPFRYFIDNMINGFEKAYGNKELKTIVIEAKSVSSFMFERYMKTGKANLHHEIQSFHYLKAQGLDEAHVAYINKDDSMMLECGVFNPSAVEDEYKKRIAMLTRYIKSGEQPANEPEVLFDDDFVKFSTNWRIEYSQYLSKLYGYKTPEEYRERWDATVASFNRTFKRVIASETGATTPTGKPILLTPLNKTTIEEMKKTFTNLDELVQKAIVAAKTDPTLLGESEGGEQKE